MAADLSRLENALVNADKAGDAEAARTIAAEISRLKAAPTAEQRLQASAPMRAVQGVRDVIDSGAQMLTHALPNGLVEGVNNLVGKVNRAPIIGPVTTALGMTPSSTAEIDRGIKDNEQRYQAARQATGNEGMDWMRMGGNIAATAPLIPMGTPTGGLLAQGMKAAPGGAAFGALQPVTDGNFWNEKAKQAATGAGLAFVTPAAAEGISRVVRPQTRQSVQTLMKEGITPTPGQILGGAWQKIEDKATSLPILGDAIAASQRKGIEDMNRALYARALKDVGGNVPEQVGREGVASVKSQLGAAYDNLLPQMRVVADQQYGQEMGRLRQMVQTLPKRESREFDNIIAREVTDRLTNAGRGSGDTLKLIESQLGKEAKRFSASNDAYQQKLGQALMEAQGAFKNLVGRSNPQMADELQNINRGYATYARLRDAASRQGSAEGIVTPAQLAAAVRAADKSVGKGAYASGNAYLQELSDAAKDVLASKYPDSGTAGRAALGALTAGGAAVVHPAILAGGAAATLPYLPVGREVAAAILTKRPESAKALAAALKKIPPQLAAPVANAVLQANE